MRIFVSAAEASSDVHAAALIRALKAQLQRVAPGERLEVFGLGGPRSVAEGLESLLPVSEFLSMGLVEVAKRLPRLIRALGTLESAARERRPDLAVVLDYPEFHFKLARRLNRAGVPVICMIPPKVWVWRSSRLKTLKALYRRVLTILPFEEDYYRSAQVPAAYIGNPLLDQLPLSLSRADARTKHGIDSGAKVLLLMPGSRPAELKYHLAPMLRAALQLQETHRKTGSSTPMKVWIPLAPTEDPAPIEAAIRSDASAAKLDWKLSRGDAWEAMVAADLGIIKSGTSTLEAAILGLPHVVVYKGHPITEWIFKTLVRYDRPVSLVNLIYDFSRRSPSVVPELILDDFTVAKMVEATVPLLESTSPAAREMRERFESVKKKLSRRTGDLSSPSEIAAHEVLEVYRGLSRERRE